MPSSPNSGAFVVETAIALWDNLPTLLLGGLLFSLFCAPAFVLLVLGWTVPALIAAVLLVGPAWSALLHLHMSLLANRATSIITMWRVMPRYWGLSVRLGGLLMLPCLLVYRLWPMLAEPEVHWALWAGFVVGLLAVAFVCALYLYAFPLAVLVEQPLPILLRNSVILASQYAGNTVGLLSMGLLFALAIAYLSLALLFILPTIYGFFIANHARILVADG